MLLPWLLREIVPFYECLYFLGILWQGREMLQGEKSRFRETFELSHCFRKFHHFHRVISLSRINDWCFL